MSHTGKLPSQYCLSQKHCVLQVCVIFGSQAVALGLQVTWLTLALLPLHASAVKSSQVSSSDRRVGRRIVCPARSVCSPSSAFVRNGPREPGTSTLLSVYAASLSTEHKA